MTGTPPSRSAYSGPPRQPATGGVPEPGAPAPGRAAPNRTPPQRVAVTGPRRHRAGGYSARPGAADLHAQPRLGQIYVRSLVRDQLRLSLGVLAVLTVVIGGLPAAFALVPALRTAELGGIRLAWLLLGVVAYPVLVGAAWFHVRHAERGERDFIELLSADPLSAYEPRATGTGADGPPTTPGPPTSTGTGTGTGTGTDTSTGTGTGTDTGDTGPDADAGTDAPGAGDR